MAAPVSAATTVFDPNYDCNMGGQGCHELLVGDCIDSNGKKHDNLRFLAKTDSSVEDFWPYKFFGNSSSNHNFRIHINLAQS
eukprot:scaffold135704_cov33-Cyclotella_meneghiniana.AAC.1